jgi:F-type H+-transporting ATPase subunit a
MHISIAAEPVFHIGSLPITNSMIATSIVATGLGVVSYFATKKMEKVPKGIQNVFETLIEFLLKMTDGITGKRKVSLKIFPFIATFFIFILFNNWFGLIPGVGTIGFVEHVHGENVFVPILRAGTADLNTTIALGIIAVLGTQFVGITTIGFFRHTKKYLNFSNPINFFVGLLELLSEITKVISFSFRLFGNVFAGEVLLTVLAVLSPYVIPVPFYIMEVFVGFIQALVFTMLTLVFYTMATIAHDH